MGADATLIDALPDLKIISNFGVGLDKIDVAAAHRRGIPVGYTPDVLDDCVADIAFGLLFDAARGMASADRFVRRGDRLIASSTREMQQVMADRVFDNLRSFFADGRLIPAAA